MKKSKIISFTVVGIILVAMIIMVAMILGKKVSSTTVSGEWTILTSEGSKEAAKTLQSTIKETEVAKVTVVTELPEKWSGRLILVGETSEAASKEAVQSLKDDEYLVQFGKEYIVIAGGTDEKTAEAVNYVCETYKSYLEEYRDLPFGSEYAYVSVSTESKAVTKQLLLDGVSVHKYQIVANKGAKNEAASYLQNAIKNMTGVELEIVEKQGDDSYGIEIQSGDNGAAKDLKDQQFRIYQDETKLYLCAANPEQEMLVVKMLLTKYMAYDYINDASTEAKVEVSGVDFKFTCNWNEFTAPTVVQSRVLEIPAEDGYSVMQGGCTDGTYAYYIVNNQDYYPYINRVYKVDLATMEVVAESDALELQHANSFTYNSKLGKLICVNYDPDKTTLSYVDPDTLKITGTREVEFNALSLAYHEEKNEYVAGTRGTFDFFMLDGDMKIQDYHESVQTKSIKQEVEIHEDKIIFGMSGPNILYVYNWDGEFLYSIDLGLYVEYENLVFYEDVAYTGYYSTGGIIYETIFYQEIQ